MRHESSVTAISWIPSEAIEGMPKLPFELGIGKYDEPPPDRLEEGDLERLRDEDRFREANLLKAWIEVDDDRNIVGYGQEGDGLVGSTTFRLGFKVTVPGVAFEVLRPEPEVRANSVRFVQTVGGRAGFPAPRRVRGKPFFRVHSATAWTTLALTIGLDGTSYHEVVGASPFPRHWIYDRDGNLVKKSGTIDFEGWYREAHGDNTPWGDEESDAFVTQAESAFERELSRDLMTTGLDTDRRELEPGEALVEQGDPGRRALPAPRRRPRGRRRRGRGRGDRARRDPRRARVPGRRRPDRDAERAHPLPGRRRPVGAGRPAGARGPRREPRHLTCRARSLRA